MKPKPIEAKVRSGKTSPTSLVIKAGDIVIQAEFSDLAPCEFPIWSTAPVWVELPPEGTKDFVVCSPSGSVKQKTASPEFPNVIKFPKYAEQDVADPAMYGKVGAEGVHPTLSKVPVVAFASVVSGVVDGKLVQTHCILPVWADSSSVLVRLLWWDGDPADSSPNPEWHMKSSPGMPVDAGLAEFVKASGLPSDATCCRYELRATPWLLAAHLLGEKGHETGHPVWQREWFFDGHEEFSNALDRIKSRLLETLGAEHAA